MFILQLAQTLRHPQWPEAVIRILAAKIRRSPSPAQFLPAVRCNRWLQTHGSQAPAGRGVPGFLGRAAASMPALLRAPCLLFLGAASVDAAWPDLAWPCIEQYLLFISCSSGIFPLETKVIQQTQLAHICQGSNAQYSTFISSGLVLLLFHICSLPSLGANCRVLSIPFLG